MTSPAEMKLCGTVAAIFSALLNETKTLDDVSEVIFEPSRNTGGLDNSTHPIKNYGIPVPFTIYKEGALQKVPPASSDAKLKPSPLTDWGDITVKYTNESMKTTLEALITKYPNSIKSFVESTSTAASVEAAAASVEAAAASAPVVAAVAAAIPAPPVVPAPTTPNPPHTRRKEKHTHKVPKVGTPTPSVKDTVAVTYDGVVPPYKVGTHWCKVIIGKGEIGKNGDHLKICSATEESLNALESEHKQTLPSADAYSNCGGVPCDTQEQDNT